MKIADQGDAKDQDQKDEAKDFSEGRVATEREAKGERLSSGLVCEFSKISSCRPSVV